jgi:hypothetical protein
MTSSFGDWVGFQTKRNTERTEKYQEDTEIRKPMDASSQVFLNEFFCAFLVFSVFSALL